LSIHDELISFSLGFEEKIDELMLFIKAVTQEEIVWISRY